MVPQLQPSRGTVSINFKDKHSRALWVRFSLPDRHVPCWLLLRTPGRGRDGSSCRVFTCTHLPTQGPQSPQIPHLPRVFASVPGPTCQCSAAPQGALGLRRGQWRGLRSQHRTFEPFKRVSGMGDRIACDVRDTEAERENVFSGESAAQDSHPPVGQKSRMGLLGLKPECQQGRVPSEGGSASGPFPHRRGVHSPWPMAPARVFKASCLAPGSPLHAASLCVQPLVVALGPPGRPRHSSYFKAI